MGISANQARLLTLTARQSDLELRAQQISAQKMVLSLQSQQWATKYSSALNDYMSNGQASSSNGHYVYSEATASDWANWLSSNGYVVRSTADKTVSYTGSNYAADINSGKYAVYKYTAATPAQNYNVSTLQECISAGLVTEAELPTKYIAALKPTYGDYTAYWNMTFAATYSVSKFVSSNGMIQYFKDNLDYLPAASLSAVVGKDLNVNIPAQPEKYELITARPPQHAEWVSDDNSGSVGNVSIETIKAEYDAAVTELSSLEKLLDMELTQINTEHQAVKTEYDSVKSLVGDNTEKSFNIFG